MKTIRRQPETHPLDEPEIEIEDFNCVWKGFMVASCISALCWIVICADLYWLLFC